MRRAPTGRRIDAPLTRLLGLETEYAIRFSPAEPGRTPGNDVVFKALRSALGRLVPTRPGASSHGRDQFFTVNGGAFYYEFLPHCMEGGLLEGSTPECRGPGQLLLYQRAQEALLGAALPLAGSELDDAGFRGELGLLKNSRDADGNVYGSQENYEVEVAGGFGLLLYRLGIVLLLPILALMTLVLLTIVLLTVAGVLAAGFLALFVPRWRRRLADLSENDPRRLENAFGRYHMWIILCCTWPLTTPFALLVRAAAFRRVRRRMTAFLVTRPILVGCGSVRDGRRFVLSEKATAVRRLVRRSILPEERPIFDIGNLMKQLCAPFNLQLQPAFRLLRRRQRLQLGCADSNRAQEAEYLRVGCAALVLDMIEDGFLADAPLLRDPVAALHAIAADTALERRLELADGTGRTALEVQRFYLESARRYLRQAPATSFEAEDVIRRWGEVLEALEEGRQDRLVGRVDWVTKRFLLEGCGHDADQATLKTLDLRYHELGSGYFDRLERAGEAPLLVDEEAIRRAIREPPADTPAFHRGRLIGRHAGRRLPIAVSWEAATIGRAWRAKVIPFRRPNTSRGAADRAP